jgi:RNA polymerase sigma-70 factor (ECF subfamily)
MELKKAIQMSKRNDAKGQRFLYDKYADMVFRLAYRYVKNKDEAEDVVVVSFQKAFSNIGSVHNPEGFDKWLRTIAINEALMCIRKLHIMEPLGNIPESLLTPNIAMESDIQADDIYELILPLGYRTVFNLFVIEGFSHKEIADKMGVSVSTSKTQLNRARKWLQVRLNKKEFGYESA